MGEKGHAGKPQFSHEFLSRLFSLLLTFFPIWCVRIYRAVVRNWATGNGCWL